MAKQAYNKEYLVGTLGIKPEDAQIVCGSCLKPVTPDMLDVRGKLLPHKNLNDTNCLFGDGFEPAYLPVTREGLQKEQKYNSRFRPVPIK